MVTILAVIAGFAIFGTGSAHAQGEEHDYVDGGLVLEVPRDNTPSARDLNIIVMNHGARTAYDVVVTVDVVYPDDSSHFGQAPSVPVGSASLKSGGKSLRWSIPALGGLQRAEVTARVANKSTTEPIFDKSLYPHEHFGAVTTSSFESDFHKRNNTSRVWSYAHNTTATTVHYDQAPADYSVNVSVDQRFPSPGDIVNFTITEKRGWATIDHKVKIELTDGLEVDDDANADPPRVISYTPSDKAASVSYGNGEFNIGTLKYGDSKP